MVGAWGGLTGGSGVRGGEGQAPVARAGAPVGAVRAGGGVGVEVGGAGAETRGVGGEAAGLGGGGGAVEGAGAGRGARRRPAGGRTVVGHAAVPTRGPAHLSTNN